VMRLQKRQKRDRALCEAAGWTNHGCAALQSALTALADRALLSVRAWGFLRPEISTINNDS
jgi:hypothetical protein